MKPFLEILVFMGIPAIVVLAIFVGVYLFLERQTRLSRKWRWVVVLLTIPALSLVADLSLLIIKQALPRLEPIQIAILEGNSSRIRNLLDENPDLVNFRTNEGRTLLWDAAFSGERQVVKTLVDGGTEVNAKDHRGETALHHAARLGEASMASLLIENGAEINSWDRENRTPLDFALGKGPTSSWLQEYGRSKVAELLIENGGLISHGIPINENAIHWAVLGKNRKTVEMLLEKGVSLGVKNKEGKTPLDIARAKGYEEIAAILEEAGYAPFEGKPE